MKLLLATALSITAFTAQATVYNLTPINLNNGYSLKGTIETDGTVGPIGPTNLVKWNITLTQTTDVVYTDTAFTPPRNQATSVVVTPQPETIGVSTDGSKLFVQRSHDTLNYADGGSLIFRDMGIYEPTFAMIADFTSYTAWYYGDSIIGGVGGWAYPGSLNLMGPLTQATCSLAGRCSNYVAATAIAGQPNKFKLRTINIQPPTTTFVQQLFGTVTTDGTIGALSSTNFTAWRITGRTQDIQTYTEQNSQLYNAANVTADATTLRVDKPSGILQIGIPSANVYIQPTIVTLADFTDPTYRNGVASYYYGNFGLVATKAPLTQQTSYVVGNI